jgi:photosystem II stability/assembly factor-like uncharacterized protein
MNRREFIGICATLLAGAAFPCPVFSADLTDGVSGWKRIPLTSKRMLELGIPGGDGFQYVHALSFAPSNPQIAYLSVDQSAVWRSDDGGRSWEPKFTGFFAYGARSLAIDPLNHLVVLAAGFLGFSAEDAAQYPMRYQGIYLTLDGGESWRMVRATDFYKQIAKGALFAFDPNGLKDPDQNRTLGVWCASASEGLLQSQDGGETWQKTDFAGTSIHDMAISPNRAGEILLATDNGLYSYSAGVARKIGQGLPSFPRSLAVSPARPEVVYVALGLDGVAISTDGGISFGTSVKVYTFFLSALNVTDIAASPVDGNRVYLRADRQGQPPYASADGGRSWNAPKAVDPEGLLGKPGFYFSSPFAPHPTDPNSCLHVTNGRARIIRTEDGGDTWHFSGSGFTGARMADILFLAPERMIFGFTDHGLWETTDNCRSFAEIEIMAVDGGKSVSALAARGGHVVAGLGRWGEKGLVVSHDGGANFQVCPGLKDMFQFLTFHPEIAGLIYAGPYVSRDYGLTWTRMSQTVLAMSSDGNTLYALAPKDAQSSTLMVSTDLGVSFRPAMELNFSLETVKQVLATPLNTIFVASGAGVYRIENSQIELQDYRHGLTRDFFGTMIVDCIAYDPNDPNRVFAGRRAVGRGNGNGIFKSIDNGKSWQEINLNFGQGITVFSIKVNPFDGDVYLGTSYGILRFDVSTVKDFRLLRMRNDCGVVA